MTEKNTPMTLAEKLAAIGKRIGAVDKSGVNAQQKYNYIEYGVVAGRIRELFDEYKLIIVPQVLDYKTDEIKSKYDTTGYHYVIVMKFTIINGEDNADRIESTWLGESADYGDKGINKAETSGTKYFLMRLFNVSEKGEEEADRVTPEIASTKRVAKVDPDDVAVAKEILNDAESFDDLKMRYARLEKNVRSLPEIVRLKDELKAGFMESDPDAKKQNAKDLIDEQFKK